MTIHEQIRQEMTTITRLRAELAAREAELQEALNVRDRTMESARSLAHARLGVSSARRLLSAHETSLEIIKRRAEEIEKTRNRSA